MKLKKYQIQSTSLIKENHELQLQIQQLQNDKQKINEEKNKLISKYKSLWAKNHHNFVLLGDMKKIMIHDVNLTDDEKKLGGIDMIKRTLAKKDEMIESLNNQLKLENHHYKMTKN